VSEPGKLNLPAKKGEPALLLLLDSRASVNVYGRNWQRFLDVAPGVGTGVSALGGGRARSPRDRLRHGTLEIVFAVGGSASGDTADILAAPLVSSHKAYRLHYLAPKPKRPCKYLASARAAIAGGSQLAYHDPEALQMPPDGGVAAWAAPFQGRGGAGAHSPGGATWPTHVLPDDSAPTVATAVRTRAPHRRAQLESSSALPAS
jgi:hypothetical protein